MCKKRTPPGKALPRRTGFFCLLSRGLLRPSWGVEVAGPEGKVELGSWGSLTLRPSGLCVREPERLVLKRLFVLDGLPLR